MPIFAELRDFCALEILVANGYSMKAKAKKTVNKNGDTHEKPSAAEVRLEKSAELANPIQREVEALRLNDRFDLTNEIELAQEVRRLEIAVITYALQCTDGNQAAAARLLGLDYSTLKQKVKHFGISPVRSVVWKH